MPDAANPMVTLYVANCTAQNARLYYRTRFNEDGTPKDENRRFEAPRQQDILSGKQAILGQRQMHMEQAMEIIRQLAKYGLTDVEDVKKTRGKVPFVFNLNRQIPVEIMKMAADRNGAILAAEGRDRRKRAAVAINDLVVQAAAAEAARVGREEVEPPNVQLTVEQLDQSEAGEKRIEEGYKVAQPDRNAPPPRANRRRASRN